MAPRLLVLLQTGTWPCGCEVTNSETDPSLDSRKEKDAAARNSLLGIFECDMLHDLLAKAEQLLNKRLGWLQKWSKTAEGHRETDFFFVRGDEAQQDGSAGGRHAHPRSRLADEPFGGRPPSAAAAVAADAAFECCFCGGRPRRRGPTRWQRGRASCPPAIPPGLRSLRGEA